MSKNKREKQVNKNDRKFFEIFVKPVVLKRDKYQCVKCDSVDNLTIHHLDYFPESVDKMETLCLQCHNLEHLEESAHNTN